MALQLSRMLVLAIFLLLTPSSINCDFTDVFADVETISSDDPVDGILGAAVIGSTVAGAGGAALAGVGTAKIGAEVATAVAAANEGQDKATKFLTGGLIALAILKGLVITQHLPLLLAIHVGKKLLGKGKRDVRTQEQLQLMDAALELANQADSGDCIAKLLCYLESLPETSLSHSGLTMKKAFGNLNKKDYLNAKTSHGVYGLATVVGATLGKSNARMCDLVFTTCPLDQNVLLDALNSTFSC